LEKGKLAFWRNGDVKVQVWKDKTCAKSTIHDATIVNRGREDRKTDMEIRKPYAVFQYNKFIKSIGQTSTSVITQF